MDKQKQKLIHRQRRHHRVRAKITGSAELPRVAVYRSLKYIYSQVIDDSKGKTICSINDIKLKEKNKTERSFKAGEMLGEMIKKNNIKKVLFDRGGFRYHGRVKALAEGLRKSGIQL
ncbi:MAG: 50S ribosomal protein L18 [bacterium]|nr:50S ribosomal protein L18 [bacterium]